MARPTLLFFILFIVFIVFAELCGSNGCPRDQEDALLEFKRMLEGHRKRSVSYNPLIFSWKRGVDCCEWAGVGCQRSGNSTEVLRLDLNELMRTFNVSSEALKPLFRVQTLVNFSISNNLITGEIPGHGLANLTKLASLHMENNNFTGTIPIEIGNLTDLQELSLVGNNLTGEIPRWIQKMSRLETLQLGSNLLSGEIPWELFELKNLKELDLGENNLFLKDGTLTSLKSTLSRLSLRSCNISGRLPLWLSEQRNLTALDLSRNSIEGSFPDWLAELDLESLYLSNNKLSGSLPSGLFQSQKLRALLLHENEFSGELPDSMGEATGLENLDLSGNHFSGAVPDSISKLLKLKRLDLSNNTLSGKLPTFGSELQYVDLSYNGFTGEVPGTMLETVVILNIGQNALTGNLPSNLNDSRQWQILQLDLHDNNIAGEIPTTLSRMSQLQSLNLRNNSLTGPIPCHLSNLTQLQILDLSDNNLTGQIPSCFGNLTGMIKQPSNSVPRRIDVPGDQNYLLEHKIPVIWKDTEQDLPADKVSLYTLLDLSSNQLTDEVPDSLGNITGLKMLNISNNRLSGHIPDTLGNLAVLESLDLSNNNFNGQIPQRFGELLQLTTLDLSNNNLSGRIPHGPQMDRFNDPSKFANNSGLCGEQIQFSCEGEPEQTKTTPWKHQSRETSWFSLQMAEIGFAVGFFLTVFIPQSNRLFSNTRACLVRRM